MATLGSIGYQTLLQYDNTGFVTLAEVIDITGPNITTAAIDSTSNDSTNATLEKIAGLTDPGTVTFNCVYTEGGLSTIYGFARTVKDWKITYPGASNWTFKGFVSNLTVNDPMADLITMDVEITITNRPTFTVV